MSRLDWETLRDADFSTLGEVAEEWSSYVKNADLRGALLEDIGVLAEGSDSHERDDFDGETADAVRAQAKRIVELFEDDLSDYASRIESLCEAAEEDLTDKQTELKDLLSRALGFLTPTGGPGNERFEVAESSLYNYLAGSGSFQAMSESEASAYEREVRTRAVDLTDEFKTLMDAAREVDDNYDAQFRALNDDPPPLPPFVGSPDFLEQAALYDAAQAAELLAGGDDGQLDSADLNALNALTEYWGDNPIFATTMLNELGPDGLLNGLYELQGSDFSNNQIATVYEHLGPVLATGTTGTSPSVNDAWIDEFMELGATNQVYDAVSSTMGYQVFGPLLAHGDYSSNFLVPVADHMLAIDNAQLWPAIDDHNQLWSPDGNTNPINYALTAFDRNPEAALDFLTEGDRDLRVGGLRPVDDRFEYLMDAAAGPLAGTSGGINPDLVGNTIEAAATGYPSDTPLDGELDPARHTNYQAEFTDRLIEYTLEHENQFTAAGGPYNPMMDNLGDITAHYMADFHQALGSSAEGENAWLPEPYGIPLALSEGGSENIDTVEQWFELLGHDEQAMGTAWAVSEGMMYGELAQIEAEAPEDRQFEGSQAVSIQAQIGAALTSGGLDGVADAIDADADAHNAKVDTYTKAAGFGISLVGGNPVTSALANEGVNWVAGDVKIDPGESYEHITAEQDEYYEQVRGDFPQETTEAAISQVLESQGIDPDRAAEIASSYSSEYDRLISRYLSGQDDEAERHAN